MLDLLQSIAIGKLNDLSLAQPPHDVLRQFRRDNLGEVLFERPNIYRPPAMRLILVSGNEGHGFEMAFEVPAGSRCGAPTSL
jgi:hypothetical protein